MSNVNFEVEMAPNPAGMLSPRARDSDPLLPAGNSSLSEIEAVADDADDVEAASLPFCRICFECSTEYRDELISPCLCKGTQQFVHRSCLDHWRSVKEGFAFSHCSTCQAQFHLRVVELQNSWRKIKFRLFVARDVFLVFLAVQMAIAGLASFAYSIDENEKFRNSIDDSWDRILAMHPMLFYYCVGVVAFLVLVGFGGTVIHCFALANNPRVAGCQNCCFGWGLLDCFPASVEVWIVIILVSIVVFIVLGIAYGFFAVTLAVQRIWQRHYHVMTKKVLTQEYVVEDLGNNYTPPTLDPNHEDRLRTLNLM